jgi:geranylgeranyl diphosphate synthase type I
MKLVSRAPEAVLDVATAWEIFHAFLLIHDDIIDGSDHRRDHPSLHRQLQSLDSDSPRFGMNLGIVAGDLMYAATQRVLADLDIPADAYRKMHKLFAHVASLTGFGQAVDILQSHVPLESCDEETLLREYHWKTAAYTFEGPMLSGAILANVPDSAREAISRFALSLGQAYQLQNDLLDLSRPATEGCDIVEGKRTLTLLRARAGRGECERAAFDATISRIQNAPLSQAIELAEILRQDLIAGDAIRQTTETIRSLIEDSAVAAEHRSLPESLRLAMRSMLKALDRSYFGSPIKATTASV